MIRFLLALIALVSGLGAEAATAHVCDEVAPGIGLTLAPRVGERLAVPAAPERFTAPQGHGPGFSAAVAASPLWVLPEAILPPAVRTGIDRARV